MSRRWLLLLSLALVDCQCLQPVSEDAGTTVAGTMVDAGAGPRCGITLTGAAVGTMPCPLVRWDQSSPERFTLYLDALGQDGRLVGLFGAPSVGSYVGSIDAPHELLLATGFVELSGPLGNSYFINVWNPMDADAGPSRFDRGGGSVSLQLSDAGARGTLDLRFENQPTDGGAPDVLQVFIVLP